MGWWDDFTGASARRDIRRGQQTALGDIDTGEAGGLDEFGRASGRLDPYASGGLDAHNAYLASLGLRGEAERARVQGLYFDDPVQNALMERITRANTRRFTGVGMGNSGAATQSLTNALLANYGGYQDRLRGLGEGGMGAATTQAGIGTQAGLTRFAAGQQRAGVNIGATNAVAQSRSTGINNLLNIAGTAARFFAPGIKPPAQPAGGYPGGMYP
jgi:hypothetical protein